MGRFGLRAALAAVLFAGATAAVAQTYPTNNPVYIPSAVKTLTALSAPGTVSMVAQGLGSVVVNVSGTFTGLVGTFQATSDSTQTVSPTWVTISAIPLGGAGGNLSRITAAGLYRLGAAGYTQLRFNATALSTGTVNVAFSGSPGVTRVAVSDEVRATYSAVILALAPASSATDLLTVTGNATTTVRILRAECSGISTANATATLVALKRSTANTGGTATAPTATPHDSNDAAAASAAAAYTANPTTGTLIGNVRAVKLTTNTAATSSVVTVPAVFDFTTNTGENVILRGAAQVFAINGAGASFSAGTVLDCSVTWTEQ